MKPWVLPCTLTLILHSWASAQVVTEMTPERLAEAIRIGETSKERDNPGYYRIQLRSGWINGPLLGVFTTPFSRVVAAAFEAKKKYKAFSPDDVKPEMLAPVLEVFAFSSAEERGTGASKREEIVNVVAVVILPKGSKDRDGALHPTDTTEISEGYQNLFGARWTGRGMRAVFPISALTEDNEMRVVYDGRRSGIGACTDCAAPFKLDKVR